MALVYNANSAPVGPKTGTVTINSVTYIVDSITYDESSTRGKRTNSDGVINANWLFESDITGTMVLQLAATTTAIPTAGQTGTYDFGQAGSATTITFVVEKVGLASNKGEDSKVTLNWFKAAS